MQGNSHYHETAVNHAAGHFSHHNHQLHMEGMVPNRPAPQVPYGGQQHLPSHVNPANMYSLYEQDQNGNQQAQYQPQAPFGYNATNHGLDQSQQHFASSWMSSIPSPSVSNQHYRARDVVDHQSVPQQRQAGPFAPTAHVDKSQYQVANYANIKGEQFSEAGDDDIADDTDLGNGEGQSAKKSKAQKGASEFVKKLFRMLDDTSYLSIVSWSPTGDSFIVREMNEFTKHVLPRHFRHSNFASFVRQLNKYDFHKVKKPEEQGQVVGVDQQWEFRHPAFVQGREDLLDHVRRKVPSTKKGSPRDLSPSMPVLQKAAEQGAEEYSRLKEQVATLTASQDQMTNHINSLTKQYQAVIGEMLTFQKNMVQQDQLMQNLIQYLMNLEADRKIEQPSKSSKDNDRLRLDNESSFIANDEAEKLVVSFSDAAKESFTQMSQIAHRAAHAAGDSDAKAPTKNEDGTQITSSGTVHNVTDSPLSPKSTNELAAEPRPQAKGKDRSSPNDQPPSFFLHPPHLEAEDGSGDIFSAAANAVENPSLAGFEGAGLRVFTVGTLQPRSDSNASDSSAVHEAISRATSRESKGAEEKKPFGISVPNLEELPANMPKVDGRTTSQMSTPVQGAVDAQPQDASTPSEGNNLLRIRRSTYVPGWAVPPKVLVVDDDDVCRKLGSKFLQVFGCAIDVAVDGVTAVNKMNLEKYDLVLMDIVMPNLDGVSATSLIREFDARTPIISMTANSGPNELMDYMSSGMTDVLPKPFTKEGLLEMLEKHLIHLKTVQKMDEIPKALGLPPVSENMVQDVLSATAASAHSIAGAVASPGEGANPMAALMGNGPEVLRNSQDPTAEGEKQAETPATLSEDEGIVNPLAGMGFSDEEYISMLQNLIAAGSVSDSSRGENADTVANIMGVGRGEGSHAGVRSKETTPISRPQARKRSTDDGEGHDNKKSRFTEVTL